MMGLHCPLIFFFFKEEKTVSLEIINSGPSVAMANEISFPRLRLWWWFLRSLMHRISGLRCLWRLAVSTSCIWERRKQSHLQKYSPTQSSLVENDPKKPALLTPQPAVPVLCPSPAAVTDCDSYASSMHAGIHTLQPHSQEADAVVQMCTRLEDWRLREIRPERNFHKMTASGRQLRGPALPQATVVLSQLFHHCHPDGAERVPVSWMVL